jgi:DNA replication protein DnaC
MRDLERIDQIATFPVTASPLLKRLQAEKSYTDEDLARDVEQFREYCPAEFANVKAVREQGPEILPQLAEINAVACRYAEVYGHEYEEEKNRAFQALKQAKPGPRRFKQTFDTLELRCGDPTVLAVAHYLKAAARSGDPAVGLMIFGRPGTYKTWLCKAARAEAVRSGNTAIVYPIRKLVYDVQKTYSSGFATEEQVIRQILSHRLICLDDLGRERGTQDAARIVSNVIDAIDRELGQHTLVITTNGTAKDLSEIYEPAMLSRIRGMCDQVSIQIEDTRGREPGRERAPVISEVAGE